MGTVASALRAALLVALSVPGSAAAQRQPADSAPALSAPISDVAYDVTLDAASTRAHRLGVAMHFTVASGMPVVLALPAWTPGSYELDFFSRWVTGFGATGDGRPLTWEKVDYDSWRIEPAGAHDVTITFSYIADTLDNAMSWTRPDFALFNGTNLFLYPEGRSLDFPAVVRVHAPAEWRVATGMTPAATPRSWGERSYHELVDMPFFVGRFDLDSTRIADHWWRFASYPAGLVPAKAHETLWQELRRVVPAQAAIFGETPFNSYTILQIADSSFAALSGLEHANSHVDVIFPVGPDEPTLKFIYAHEIFHAWNVKRLRPADLWPYRYDRAQPTTWLWVSEGLTDYYADLTLLRGGAIDSVAWMRSLTDRIREVDTLPVVALDDASLSTWVKPADGTADIYYSKGALAGLMLDVMIRDASDNRGSLDDVMRRLYREAYKNGRGFTREDWWGAVNEAAGGRSFTDFDARFIAGREPYPWRTLLPMIGLRLAADTTRDVRLGITSVADSSGLRITQVEPGSSAAAAGVEAGDYLLGLGDIAVTDPAFAEKFHARLAGHDGAPLVYHVRRDGAPVTLNGAVRLVARVQLRVEADPHPSAKALRLRSALFKHD